MFRSFLRQPRVLLALVALYWLILIVGTHLPEPDLPRVVETQDKLVHASAYGLLTLLVLFVWRSTPLAIRPISYLVLAVCMGVHAAADEMTQRFVSGRTPDLLDWTADMLGVFVAVILAERIFRRTGGRQWLASSTTSADAAG